ncbi:hypothetical protein M427DRAFT_56829 [Gonapodya prolifera JEL478]|uniref:Uncharacterized protein n=1 Tax=Gonapodya prolifera (strain JEL478) TaxID=1344416 RepID=A0A139AFF7_GONPJ|nr:hypothetical protein M427DRAFT_56829 [Gonapodya prolifera JEL478]|eukprot:KXS15490.1 hypothetical protein M427DRAFT_56829 [Gonapodya prolifera JEL478]
MDNAQRAGSVCVVTQPGGTGLPVVLALVWFCLVEVEIVGQKWSQWDRFSWS